MTEAELLAQGWIPIAIVAAGCAATLALDAAGYPRLAGLAKVTASGGFLALAYVCGAAGLPAGFTFVFALALSAVGDAALVGRAKVAFVAGLGAFFLGHVAFAAAFLGRELAQLAVLLTAGILVFPSLAFERWLGPRTGALRPAVAAYIIVVGLMVCLAVGAGLRGASPLLPVGAALFWVSDICVALNRFVRPDPWTRRVGLPLYFAGQVLMVLGFAALDLAPA